MSDALRPFSEKYDLIISKSPLTSFSSRPPLSACVSHPECCQPGARSSGWQGPLCLKPDPVSALDPLLKWQETEGDCGEIVCRIVTEWVETWSSEHWDDHWDNGIHHEPRHCCQDGWWSLGSAPEIIHRAPVRNMRHEIWNQRLEREDTITLLVVSNDHSHPWPQHHRCTD